MSLRAQPDRTEATKPHRTDMATMVAKTSLRLSHALSNRDFMDLQGRQGPQKRAGYLFAEGRVRAAHAEEEPIIRCAGEGRDVEDRMIGHGQAVGDEEY